MSVDKKTSLSNVRKQLEDCKALAVTYGWRISDIDEENLLFIAKLTSSVDNQIFYLEVRFDNFPEIPLLLEFINEDGTQRGLKKLYPKSTDSFFHSFPCICNPCSRKAYKSFDKDAPHGDWSMIGWQKIPDVTSLTNIGAILGAIQVRINSKDEYSGRME